MQKFFQTAAVLLAAAFLFSQPMSAAEPPKRIALIIGNGDYRMSGWALSNPPRDARLISERLRRLGYDVDFVRNATRGQMLGAFERFGRRLLAAGPDAVSVFYYAGHGAQSNGVNHLVPVDSTARTMDRLRLEAPPAQLLLDYMTQARNSVNIVILDACRNVPLEEGQRDGAGGLAAFGDLPNVFVAYAAAPGRTASDGTGDNSPYAIALASALAEKPAVPVSLLFEEVQSNVWHSTGYAQKPEYRNGLLVPGWAFAVGSPTPITPSQTAPAPAPIGTLAAGNQLEALQTRVAVNPQDVDARLALVRALRAENHSAEAIDQLKAVLSLQSEPADRSSTLLEIARATLGSDDFTENDAPVGDRVRFAAAMAALDQAVETSPNPDARLLRGKLFLFDSKKAEAARADFLTVAREGSDALKASANYHVSLMEMRAQFESGRGNAVEAMRRADAAISLDQLNYGYRGHACLVSILFGRLADGGRHCLADEMRAREQYPTELLYEGLYFLRRSMLEQGSSMSLSLDRAAQSFSKGVRLVDARGDGDADAVLRARLVTGQGLTTFCSRLESLGRDIIASVPESLAQDARDFYRRFGVDRCGARP